MRKFIYYILFIVLIISGLVVFVANSNTDSPTTINASSQNVVSLSYKQRDPIQAGYFTYKVLAVKKVKYLDTGFSYEKSDGAFWIVKLSVTNNNTETRMLDSSMFAIRTQDGTTYEPTSKGELRKGTLFLKQIQPHLPTKGMVIFEVPPDLKNAQLLLSGGIGNDSKAVPLSLSRSQEYDDR